MSGIKRILLIIPVIALLAFSQTLAGNLSVGENFKYKTISSAIAAASDYDTVFIQSGIYSEGTITIQKPLTLIGLNSPVLSGEGEYEILLIRSDDVEVQNLIFRDTGISFIEDNAAVKIDSAKNCVVKNNIFINNFFSVYLAQAYKCKVLNNEIRASQTTETRSGNGIHLWYCKDIDVTGNTIEGHRDGIYFEFVESSRIKNNFSSGNLRYGLHFMFSDSCTYEQNTFERNGAGVAVMYTHTVKMINNVFRNNWGGASYGLLLKEISDAEIIGNNFTKNSTGVYLEGCNRVRSENNTFTSNGWAIRLMANSFEIYFNRNNFISNTFNVSTNSMLNHNFFTNNYWSNYSGYDLDKNGIGDVPFHPVRLFSFIVEQNRPALILLRSMFVSLLDYSESIFPMLTPETLVDTQPAMRRF